MNKVNLSLILLLSILLTSCVKSYKYIEKVSRVELLGGIEIVENEAKTIKAKDDSTAYVEAFRQFCLSVKVHKEMVQSKAFGDYSTTPISFRLLNENEVDISNSIIFANKFQLEKEIESQVFSSKNSVQESLNNSNKKDIEKFKKTLKIDLAKIKALKKYFTTEKDEFSKSNLTWYKPKTAPKYTNQNGLYCYFQTENDMPSNLRFRLQYYSDEWLFFSKVQFSIDGKAYEYIPLSTETDNGDGGYIWEWFDESITNSDKKLINALSNAKSAKMKLIGRQYYDVRSISKEQIKNIKRTLDLYKEMGGK